MPYALGSREPEAGPAQSAILLFALVLAAAGGAASFAGLAYVVAWALVNAAMARGIAMPALDRPRAFAIAILIAVAPAMALASRWDALVEHEALAELSASAADRRRSGPRRSVMRGPCAGQSPPHQPARPPQSSPCVSDLL